MSRVLIVDDLQENLYYLEALLSAHGHEVDIAPNGAEALAKARQSPPDLVVSDLLMPVMDGYTLLRHWRADLLLGNIRFVVYTATYTEAEDERLALALGADAFILKPTEPEQLLARITDVLANKGPGPKPRGPREGDDVSLMQSYNESLIRKLEERTLQLQESNRALRQDIAKREQAEAQLRLLNAAILQSTESVLITDAELDAPGPRIVFANPAFTRLTGYGLDEVIGKTPRILQGPRTDRAVLRRLRETLARGETFADAAAVNYRKDGSEYDQEWQIGPIRDAHGKVTHFVAVQRDVTERNRTLQALQDSNREQRQLAKELGEERRRLLAAQRVANVGSWETNLVTGSVLWSEQTHRIHETQPGDFEPTHALFLQRVHPDDRAHVDQALADSVERGNGGTVEHRLQMPDGRINYLEERWLIESDANGVPVRALGTCQDVTDRKQAEAALRESEERYRTLFERAPDGIVILEPGGHYVDVNAAICQMVGYTREEMIGRHGSTVVAPAEVPHIQEALDEVSAGADYHRVWKIRRKDGSVFSAEAVATQMPNGNMIGIVRDITDRQRAEAALRESEGKLRKVIDGLGPYMFVGLMTTDGVLIEANRPALEAAGLAPADVLGMPYVDTYWWAWSEAVQQRLLAAIGRAAAGSSSRYDEQVRVANGTVVWVDFSICPVHGPDGEVILLVPSAMIIDERKEAEASVHLLNAALEQRVRERTAQLGQVRNLSRRLSGIEEAERRNITRELHDRVGPNLVALKLSLGMMRTTVPADGSGTAALEDAREVLEQTIAQLRNVMSDLRPPALDDYGLLAAIRSYAERYGARLDAEVRVEGADLAPRPSLAVETALFRIAQEALNNIAKHAHARHVVIAAQRCATGISLTITDDGVGFNTATAAGAGGLGLRTMRERAQGLGAVFSVESSPGGPTCIAVTLECEPT